MGRQPRIQFPGAIYHVFARGIERKNIFLDRVDYTRFLEALVMSLDFAQYEVWCYALMDTHYHLLIKTPNGNLVQAMHHLQNNYVKYFNKTHKRVGPLFQGRYKAIVVVDLSYLKELSRYIHLNPLRKGLEKKLGLYEWNSYRFYSGHKEFPGWLVADELLQHFGSIPEKAYANHRDYVVAGKDLPLWDPFSVTVERIVLGSMKVLRKLLRSAESDRITISKGLLLDKMHSVDDVVDVISKYYNVPHDLVLSRRSSGSEYRNMAIYLSRLHTGSSLSELGIYFGGVSYSTIAKICKKCRELERTDDDPEFAEKVATLQSWLTKS